jgi:hypothetical protein
MVFKAELLLEVSIAVQLVVLHSTVSGLTMEEENRLRSIWHPLAECSIFFGCINFCLVRLHSGLYPS